MEYETIFEAEATDNLGQLRRNRLEVFQLFTLVEK